VYSLPQDVHISSITREGSTPIDAGEYGGFNAAYASRVARLDACFGEFIDDLKARGLYDQSVVILTSDHGDSLGEEGRMGHAYTIFPEIIQVPLLVHLPAALRPDFSADPSATAFTSDISPSLYALLGHAPARPSELFGQPLFHTAASAPSIRQSAEVVASSYGSVYGALLDDARKLYIIDAVSLREHVYELDGSAAGRSVPVRAADRDAGQRAVRATVDEIARFYAYRPASSSRIE
jgi:arylsulfatase A-like enzyme